MHRKILIAVFLSCFIIPTSILLLITILFLAIMRNTLLPEIPIYAFEYTIMFLIATMIILTLMIILDVLTKNEKEAIV